MFLLTLGLPAAQFQNHFCVREEANEGDRVKERLRKDSE
jgi:hypothetical protein